MRILVTAGPTREAIDSVRFISNRSSGKMGYAVARAALARGHETQLVSGPVDIEPPAGVTVTAVQSARQMCAAVQSLVEWCDALVMSAAVADWTPARPQAGKLKKTDGAPVLDLVRTPDILEGLQPMKGDRIFVGFAAEFGDPLEEAESKRAAKGLDLVVGNDISQTDSGFETDTNRVVFVGGADDTERLPLLSKDEVARRIVMRLEDLRAGRAGGGSRTHSI